MYTSRKNAAELSVWWSDPTRGENTVDTRLASQLYRMASQSANVCAVSVTATQAAAYDTAVPNAGGAQEKPSPTSSCARQQSQGSSMSAQA